MNVQKSYSRFYVFTQSGKQSYDINLVVRKSFSGWDSTSVTHATKYQCKLHMPILTAVEHSMGAMLNIFHK